MQAPRRFYFRLALALGMTVEELLSRISSHELSEWLAYYRLEPFGQDRPDVGAAIVAATVANVNRPEEKEPYTMRDFLPVFDIEAEDEGPDHSALLEKVRMINAAFGGLESTK